MATIGTLKETGKKHYLHGPFYINGEEYWEIHGCSKKFKREEFEDGYIVIDGYKCLLVRGWGMLTGIGAYNLKIDYAAKIQDEFANWCVNKLSH